MNPQLTFDLNLSFFTNLFSSKNEDKEKEKEEENKKKKKSENIPKKKKEEKQIPNSTKEKEREKEKLKEKISKNESSRSVEITEATNSEEDEKILDRKFLSDSKINIVTISEKEELKQKEEEEKPIQASNQNEKENNPEKSEIKPKTKEFLINYLINYIKNIFLFRKRVKILVKKHKENFAIMSSLNKKSLCMNIKISEEKINQIKPVYEPILKETIFYISRKMYKKKNLVKFSFVNKKNEAIIDPKFNTEYDEGEFINVINLKKIKDKEEENEEEFQSYLESFMENQNKLRASMSKNISGKSNKLSLGDVRVRKKHKTTDFKGKLNFGIHKLQSNSILKQRPKQRITSNKKLITFSEKNETYAYKKDE